MSLKIEKVEALTVGTTAQDVNVGYRSFLIANNSANSVYFKEKAGAACTSANGFLVPKATVLQHVFTADVLSVIASGASSDVRILFVDPVC